MNQAQLAQLAHAPLPRPPGPPLRPALTACARCDRQLGNPCYIVMETTVAEDLPLAGNTVCEICEPVLRAPPHSCRLVVNRCFGGFVTDYHAFRQEPPAAGPA